MPDPLHAQLTLIDRLIFYREPDHLLLFSASYTNPSTGLPESFYWHDRDDKLMLGRHLPKHENMIINTVVTLMRLATGHTFVEQPGQASDRCTVFARKT